MLKTLEKTREDAFYIVSEEFLNSFIQGIKNGTTEDFREKVRGKNLLLLDDVQFLAGKKAVSEELLHTLNHYIENEKGVVLVSDVKPKELVGFPERLISRVYSGLVTDIEKPDKDLLYTFIKNSTVESDLSKKLIYFRSPIGKGLIGKNKNDLVEITTPAGLKNFEIKDVKYF